MADINVYDNLTVSEYDGVHTWGGNGLAGLPYRCIDIMKRTKDSLDNNTSVAESDNLIESLNNHFNLTHIGISVPMNTNAEAIADRGYAFDSEPAAYAAQFCDKIHAVGLNVLFRGTDCTFEYENGGGLYDMTYAASKRNGNRYTYLAEPITDDFNSTQGRSHGYNLYSSAGSLSNYTYPYLWQITSGELVGPAGSGWSRYIYFNAPYLRDVTIQAKVKKVGNQQVIVRASTNLNYPGYGLQMRDGNELRLERPGLEALASTSKTWVENNWYWLKLEATGTTIRGKAWEVGTTEPGSWDLSITNSTYSSGYCGFSGEGSYGHFDDMTITPAQDTDSWVYKACTWLSNNISLFTDGDLIAPFPEADIHQQLDEEGNYITFWPELKYCIDRICANNNLVCENGYNSQQIDGVLQFSRNGDMFNIPKCVSIDHYGYPIGLGKRWSSGSSASQTNVSGTDTYTLPTSLIEDSSFNSSQGVPYYTSTHTCWFIPEKCALNQDIDIYVVNKGTGDWTMVIHDQYNNPVQLPDHTDFSSKTNNYIVNKANSTLTNNAWNTFTCYWDNPQTDRYFHFHLYSTVADGTVRVLSGTPNVLTYCAHEQFKSNATPEAIEIDIRKVSALHGQPVFLEEWGDFWSTDPLRSTPIRTEAQHIEYLQSMYDAFSRLANDNILKGFNYWEATDSHEAIVYDADPSANYGYEPLYEGTVLSTYLVPETDFWNDNIEVSESVAVARVGAGVNLINVLDSCSIQDVVTTVPPASLYISGSDILDQNQPLGAASAGFGEWASVRYRGQGFKTTGSRITAISFQLQSVGSQGLKIYIDTADASSLPTHAIGSELYSWTLTNSQLSIGLTKYTLPIPLDVTPGTQYCIYFAPWNTTTGLYTDNYRDLSWQAANVYSNGYAIVNTNGTWAISDSGNLDMRFEIYTQSSMAENINISESVTVSTAGTPTPAPASISIQAKGVVITG